MQPPTVTVTLKEFSGKYSLDPLTYMYQCTNQKKGGGGGIGWEPESEKIRFKAKATLDAQ